MKNIWIINHYATDMFENKGGRHFWFAKNLIKQGYNPTIFCANTFHQKKEEIDLGNDNYKLLYNDDIPFIFIKTKISFSNGFDRIKNMIYFYINLLKVTRKLIKNGDRPDLILASSVHPLTLVAGIKLGKKYHIPVICEIRDLWPESIVAYSSMRKSNLIIKMLYQGEKWIYKKADRLIFTWEGAIKYIRDNNWERTIDIKKISYINNGIDLEEFLLNAKDKQYNDCDLENFNYIKIIYAGSIRKVNNLNFILDVAKNIKNNYDFNVKFLIFGVGNEKENLVNRVAKENIDNVIFKGQVKKSDIPYILSQADITLLHNNSTNLN